MFYKHRLHLLLGIQSTFSHIYSTRLYNVLVEKVRIEAVEPYYFSRMFCYW